jgi:hypothetical protein
MTIYTSWFKNLKNVENPVSIALYRPKDYTGPAYMKLAPSSQIMSTYRSMIRGSSKESVERWYTMNYNHDILSKLSVDEVLEDLSNLYPEERSVTLVCYEPPGDFCHRFLVADWFKFNGIIVKEVENDRNLD